jgi:very-short-patch-repair endonuclease
MPYDNPRLRLRPTILRHARESRHAPTRAEESLWAQLRAHRSGTHFRRQHSIDGRFVVDFYCTQARLCIEIDGESHAEPEQAQYDAARTARLNELGYRVLRFSNAQVVKNLEAVVEAIREACRIPFYPSPENGRRSPPKVPEAERKGK